jgi:2-amino-4-hydroxy-6-hydroxymethyldihydropteridine diphosphokinase
LFYVKFKDIFALHVVQYMNKVYLLIGGNVGSRLQNLSHARDLLSAWGTVIQQSAVYETEAWGKTDQEAFFNQAIVLETPLQAKSLIINILQIEEEMGRRRLEKYGPRIIDIDILFFNDQVIREPHLTIPHPEIQNRRFALVPMLEIAPEFVHPVFNKTIGRLLDECPDKLAVQKIEEAP